MKDNVIEAVNRQIQAEISSAYLYLSMAAYFEEKNLSGFSQWMRIQWQEEIQHGMKFFDLLIDRDERVLLQAIPMPEHDFGTALEAFREVLRHEQKITAMINELYDLATKERDYPLQNLLQWFIDEQVEEENSVRDIIHQLELIGDNGTGLYMLDREMAQRQVAAQGTSTA